MARKCFISFKTEDVLYKEAIQNMNIDLIDKSLNDPIQSQDEDYIMRKIREDYLSDSTVTIHLIGSAGAEDRGYEEQKFIKRELQASLYNGAYNTRNGLLGVVLPHMYETIYRGGFNCNTCSSTHNHVAINDSTVVSEFSHNFYIPHSKCHHGEDDRYCILVRWDEFKRNPELHIESAFSKRDHHISNKIKVRP